jgi:MEMO1 family protein
LIISDPSGTNKRGLAQPRLRPIQVIPVNHQGQDVLCLMDPGRLVPPLFLAPMAAYFLPYFDGCHDREEIQAALKRQYGESVPLEVIEELIHLLDKHCFLEGESYDKRLVEEMERFRMATARASLLAGESYPADPLELTRSLQSYFLHPKGPGSMESPGNCRPPQALVAPHIDFPRGGPCYAWAYRELPRTQPPDVVVILGTAHCPMHHHLALCRKDYDTPFGPAVTDRKMIAGLEQRLGSYLDRDEFVHRGEHSVEFQAVWLKSHYPDASPAILPLLCGSFEVLMMKGLTPEDDPAYEEAVAALLDAIHEITRSGKTVTIMASADLSHVGPQFGDREAVTAEIAERVKAYDLALMDAAARGDYQAFYRQIADNRDATHVCGVSCIYALLRLNQGRPGRLLAYDQWLDENGQGMVSFAGLAF